MQKQLLIIGFVWPEPNSSAAGSRMMQLISCFKSEGYSITFASACAKTTNAFDLTSFGIDQVSIELNHSSFDEFILKIQPDIVLFDRFMTEEQYGWRVSEHCPEALRILDTEDLHCLRKGRQQAFKDQNTFDTSYVFNDVAKREIASIYRCDLSLIISEAEIDLLTQVFKVNDSLLHYLPFLLDPLSEVAKLGFPEFKERDHFVTIGNFLHPPNYQSVVYLKEHIWPAIRQQLPNAELHIYGAYASQKVTQLHNEKHGFLIKGYTEIVSEVIQKAKVCLAPLQFGAGLKGKLIDAMQSGTPCVMSSIAAEGMFGNHEANGFITDNETEFVNSAIALHTNESIWNQTQEHGFKVINTRFQRSEFQANFIQLIHDLKSVLITHRRENFIGQMLQHHNLQSTKFMSKWIEEKNKDK
ncbi:glycosyltransferase [Psychroserpens ponticola]|uniref:Glycosyltransferase family 4 protein n=1 Tax=Psychroserpens ponticola TaxID=2932268 RepID=A0ABY7RUD9_9FLAO|nr:glycosyltransferase family 4 protein [Psychroserpens ponticola]WCO00336.1 glycosyltransferase family 4 protein [Psychroserpens ponticola]